VPDLSTGEALLRLLLAAALGGAIGFERELRDHEAGLRTHLLVALGACVFTLVSAYAWTDWTFSQRSGVTLDPTRIAAQIVTGIGFLGAGAIIVRGINVRGLTTAATLWVVAGIGMAVGTGYYAVSLGASVLVLISLGPLRLLSARLMSQVRPEQATLAINLAPRGDRTRVLARIEELDGEIETVEFGDDRVLDVVLRASTRSESARVADGLAQLDDVEHLQWRP
jgi:putative Mg2+ transporter-C (MgtC) family protein